MAVSNSEVSMSDGVFALGYGMIVRVGNLLQDQIYM